MPDRLLTERQASKFLDVPMATLRAWRCRGKGPDYVRYREVFVRYRVAVLEAFHKASVVDVRPTRSDPPARRTRRGSR